MAEKHIPGRLQIGTECNHNCLFCSVPKFPVEMLPFEELKKRIDELKRHGTNDLFITGGEPIIHKEFLKILDYAHSKGFNEITIQSNGTRLDEPLLNKIKSYGNVKFDISFHSFKKEIFNRLSSSQNYEEFLKGMRMIKQIGIPTYLTIVINKLNYQHLKEHVQFIHKNFPNIKHFSFNFVDPTARCLENKNIVPTLVETQRYIHETVSYILENGMTFRLERVPLCYMQGFEEFSTEARMNASQESRFTSFADKTSNNLQIEIKIEYLNAKACSHCLLTELCPGINPNYIRVHGSEEVYPSFIKLDSLTSKIKKSKAC